MDEEEKMIRSIDGIEVDLAKHLTGEETPEYKAAWEKGWKLENAKGEEPPKLDDEPSEETGESPKPTTAPATLPQGTSLICPICGQPLYKAEIGGDIFYQHMEDNPCKEFYSSPEDVENTRKKLEARKAAQEKAEKAKRKKSIEDALLEAGESGKVVNKKLDNFINEMNRKTQTMDNTITDLKKLIDEKLSPLIDEIHKDQSASANQAVADFLQKNYENASETNTSISGIMENIKTITNFMKTLHDNQQKNINFTNDLKKIETLIRKIHISWQYTVTPIDKSMVSNLINQAGENEPYYCVKDELTKLNNILTDIRDFQKRINDRLDASMHNAAMDPEDLEKIREVETMGRALLNAWPPKLTINRADGELITQQSAPAPQKTEEEEFDDELLRY